MLRVIRVTTGFPVTLEMVKAHLRVDHGEEDEYLLALIETATHRVEAYLERSLFTRRWSYLWQKSQESLALLSRKIVKPEQIPLKMGPVNEILSVSVIEKDERRKPIRYMVDWRGAMPSVLISREHAVVEIVYEAGYGTRPTDVPPPVRQAIMETVAEFYDNRGAIEVPANRHVQGLLQPYKVRGL